MALADSLTRRERQVMETVHRLSRASVEEIRVAMPQPATYSTVRIIVNVLERKGHVRHEVTGKKFIYRATTPRAVAAKEAVRHLLGTYFEGSLSRAVAAMVQLHSGDLTDRELKKMISTIRRTRKEDSQ